MGTLADYSFKSVFICDEIVKFYMKEKKKKRAYIQRRKKHDKNFER